MIGIGVLVAVAIQATPDPQPKAYPAFRDANVQMMITDDVNMCRSRALVKRRDAAGTELTKLANIYWDRLPPRSQWAAPPIVRNMPYNCAKAAADLRKLDQLIETFRTALKEEK
jgi:hypothetical protein